MNGVLVILSGPSGVGKDTVLDAWRAANPRVRRVVAYTTRTPRAGEVDGEDYHFVSVPEFMRKAETGDFLEHKQVHDNWYATPLRDMEAMLEQGLIAVLKIDVQGAIEAMRLRPDAKSVFLLPPSDEELERRIRSRKTDSPEAIERRLRNARDEIALSHHYAFRIVNDDLETCVRSIDAWVAS
ncbi:MAG: guanylate kinase [Nitrospirae bacterium]|nr:guanylate kinase [Fimbriimonadaceae bacterium]